MVRSLERSRTEAEKGRLRSTNAGRLLSEIRAAVDRGADQLHELVSSALRVAEDQEDLELLIALLECDDCEPFRADMLATALGLANESSIHFTDLMRALRPGEQILVLGARLEASRFESDRGRRLLRLKRLVQKLPRNSRGLYWPEAAALAETGGDDAQLALIGVGRELPSPIRPLASATLKRASRRVQNSFKRAMAFIALSDMIELDDDDLREARASAASIPDDAMRAATQARVAMLESAGGS